MEENLEVVEAEEEPIDIPEEFFSSDIVGSTLLDSNNLKTSLLDDDKTSKETLKAVAKVIEVQGENQDIMNSDISKIKQDLDNHRDYINSLIIRLNKYNFYKILNIIELVAIVILIILHFV